MSFQEPTFEEYKRATTFAKIRYKYGLIIVILAWITLILLIGFVVWYADELASSPLQYAARSIDGECYCNTPTKSYYFNSTHAEYKLDSYYFPGSIP